MPSTGTSGSPLQMNNPRMSTPQFKSAKSTPLTTPATPTNKSSSSFKVENESSPYAFEPEPLEISGPYRKKSEKSEAKKEAKKAEKPEKTVKKQANLEDFNLKDLDSSISLPPELASQLAAQAQSDKNEGKTKETTYFIPLQKANDGQSFGVSSSAVCLQNSAFCLYFSIICLLNSVVC